LHRININITTYLSTSSLEPSSIRPPQTDECEARECECEYEYEIGMLSVCLVSVLFVVSCELRMVVYVVL
jgi:hypothetical protein